MAREIGGIRSVLDGLVSDGRAREPRRTDPKAEGPSKGDIAPSHNGVLIKARQGRPPGRQSGKGTRKAKATLRVSAELMDDYREWSWEERCNLGELVERALEEHRRRHRGLKK